MICVHMSLRLYVVSLDLGSQGRATEFATIDNNVVKMSNVVTCVWHVMLDCMTVHQAGWHERPRRGLRRVVSVGASPTRTPTHSPVPRTPPPRHRLRIKTTPSPVAIN
jgi:hypothetical protein